LASETTKCVALERRVQELQASANSLEQTVSSLEEQVEALTKETTRQKHELFVTKERLARKESEYAEHLAEIDNNRVLQRRMVPLHLWLLRQWRKG
jgi:predicted  nucleic acid-binding Zn-ribbon protein